MPTAVTHPAGVVCTAPKTSGYRTSAGWRAGDRQRCFGNPVPEINLPAKFTQSARVSPACADTGGLRGILLPAFRPRAQFFPIVKAIGSLFLVGIHSAFAVRQNLPCWTTNLLHFSVLSRLHFHAQQQSMEFDAWRTEKLSLRNTNQGMSV